MQLSSLKKQYLSLKQGKDSLLQLVDENEMPVAVYNSNEIESKSSALFEQQATASVLAISNLASVHNYVKAMATERKANSEIVLQLHEKLMASVDIKSAGQYRDQHVSFNGRMAPAPELIGTLVNELFLDYYNQENNTLLERVAKFHLEFVVIHPFNSGVGRIARALINYQLIEIGYPPIVIRASDQTAYAKCFDDFEASRKVKSLVELLEVSLKESLNHRIAYLSGMKIINLVDHARDIKLSESAMLNKAKRQTIPAFREGGRWKIGVGYAM